MSSVEEAEFEASGEASSISLAQGSTVVKTLLSTKAPGVDETHPEGSGHCRAVLADTHLQCHMEVMDSTCGVADRGVLQLSGYHTAQRILRCWKGGSQTVAPHLQKEQCGFRPGHGTVDTVLTRAGLFAHLVYCGRMSCYKPK